MRLNQQAGVTIVAYGRYHTHAAVPVPYEVTKMENDVDGNYLINASSSTILHELSTGTVLIKLVDAKVDVHNGLSNEKLGAATEVLKDM